MKKNKTIKKIVIAGSIIVAIIIILIIGKEKFDWFNPISEFDEILAKTLEGYNNDIVVYGDLKSSKKIKIKYRQIDSLTEEQLIGDDEDRYHLIVLSDIGGKLQISDEEIELLYSLGMDKHFDIIYFGNAHIKQLCKGFRVMQDLSDEWAMFFNGYAYQNGFPFEFINGEWKRTDEINSYVSHPNVELLGYDETDNRRAAKESLVVWQWIGYYAKNALQYY